MAMTEKDLIRLLDQCGVPHLPPLENQIPFKVKAGNRDLIVTVGAHNDGQFVQFRTLNVVMATETRYRRVLLSTLLRLNFTYKLIKFAWDASDGEVVCYIDLVVGKDGTLTMKQFRRCLRALDTTVAPCLTRIEKIIETGVDPGETTSPNDLLQSLTRALEDAATDTKRPSKTGSSPTGGADKGNRSRLDSLLGDLLDDDDKGKKG